MRATSFSPEIEKILGLGFRCSGLRVLGLGFIEFRSLGFDRVFKVLGLMAVTVELERPYLLDVLLFSKSVGFSVYGGSCRFAQGNAELLISKTENDKDSQSVQ